MDAGYTHAAGNDTVVCSGFETKRTYKVQSMTIKLANDNPRLYLDDFAELNQQIQKNCKDFMLIDENQYDWAIKVTKPIVIQPKEKKKEKKKPEKF